MDFVMPISMTHSMASPSLALLSGNWQLATGNSPLAAAFLTPAFFWAGLGLASIPIIIHILNRRRFKVVPWAAMEYLLAAMRKNRRRLKFEHWLLLAIRCLVLALLGFALARPLGCDRSTLAGAIGRTTGLHVFIIDNSYSMAYEADRPDAKTHLDQAKRLAQQLIDRAIGSGESVVVLTASAGMSDTAASDSKLDRRLVIPKPTYDREQAKAAIARIEQSYLGTDLPWALNKAIEIGKESKEPRKILYVFTDATRSAWEGQQGRVSQSLAAAGPELARLYHVEHFNLGKKEQSNHVILDLGSAAHLVTTRFPADFIAEYAEFGSGPQPLVQWKLDDQPQSGGGSVKLDKELKQTISHIPSGGPHVLSVSLVSDDRLKGDDVRSRVIDVASELKILIVEGDRGVGTLSGSAAFLELALAAPTEGVGNTPGSKSDSYITPEVISDLELGNKVLGNYRAVILTNVAQIPQPQAEQLKRYVQQGGALVFFLGDQIATPDSYNKALLPLKLMPGPLTKLMSVGANPNGFTLDFRPHGNVHPLLDAFRDQEKSGLNTAQVFTYWQLDVPPDSQVQRVLNYLPPGTTADESAAPADKVGKSDKSDQRDPAITLEEIGEGHVVFITTSADASWTSLPAKPAYVALVHEILGGIVRTGDVWMNRLVGQSLELPPALQMTSAPVLVDWTGKELTIDQATNRDGQAIYRSQPLEKPGVYTLKTGSATIPIAVNVPADEEADIRTLDNSAIQKSLGGIPMELEGDQLPAEAIQQASGNDWSWALMLAVLLLTGLECLLAMRFGHYRRQVQHRTPDEPAARSSSEPSTAEAA